METKKIFLASSSELKEDRQQFEIFVYRKNIDWLDKNVFLELIVWDNFLDAVSQTRLQGEYNKAIQDCDIFIMLFFSKVGKYTEEEFDIAFKSFKEKNKPHIFTYFKDAQISTSSINKEILTLLNFKEKLGTLGHFYSVYKNIEELQLKFSQQLEKLVSSGFIDLAQLCNKEEKAKKERILEVNIAKIRGDNNTVFQGIKNSSFEKQ